MSLHVTAECIKSTVTTERSRGWTDRAVVLVPWKLCSLEIFWANLIHNSDKIQQSSSTIEKERKVLRIKIVSLCTDRRLRWSNIEPLTLRIYSMVGCFKSPRVIAPGHCSRNNEPTVLVKGWENTGIIRSKARTHRSLLQRGKYS